jgi:Flp pilus assembly protein TadG
VRILKDESGQALTLVAAMMALVILGFVALACDVGYLFHERRMVQIAADAAALAAAEEDAAGDSSNAQAAADGMAKLNGFDTTLAQNPAVVNLSAPTSGNFVGSSYVQANVYKTIPTVFLSAFSHGGRSLTVSASAVAGGGQSSPTCVCLEGTSGMDLNMSNNSKLTANSCGVTVDSSSSNAIGIVGSATLSAVSLGTVSSDWDNSSNINNAGTITSSTRIVQGISTQCSPSLPAAPTYNSAQCSADPFGSQQGGAHYTVGPNSTYGTTQTGSVICYNALTVNGNGDTVTLNPGIYVINGGELHFESGTNGGGTGVFFYLVGAANLVIDNGANVNLSAPTSGTYSGVLVYQASGDTAALSVQGGSSASFNGNIYAPSASITLGNGSGSTFNSAIVAQSLTMNGGGTLTSSSTANLGTLNLTVAKIVE